MKKYLILILTTIIFTQAFSQKKHNWNYEDLSKFFLSFGMGGNIPLHSSSSSITGNLVNVNNNGQYLQAFSATLFVYKKWGITFNIRPEIPNNSDTSSKFLIRLNALYGNKYFVSTVSSVSNGYGDRGSFMAGPVYKITKGRFMFAPKLLFGVELLYPSDGYVMLKEKNGNEIIDLSYIPLCNSKAPFTISPAFTVSFRAAKRLGVNLDVNYYWLKPTVSFISSSYNYKTQIRTDDIIIKNSTSIQKFTIGAGVSILIK